MCQQAEETTPHLLQEYSWGTKIWAKGESLLNQPILEGAYITDMAENWSKKVFKNPILNRIWEVLLGLVVWEIWKE